MEKPRAWSLAHAYHTMWETAIAAQTGVEDLTHTIEAFLETQKKDPLLTRSDHFQLRSKISGLLAALRKASLQAAYCQRSCDAMDEALEVHLTKPDDTKESSEPRRKRRRRNK